MSTRKLRASVGVLTLALATLGIAWTSIATASGATSPKIVVTPSLKLHNKEVVHVHGTGFTPGDTVYIVQCLRNAKGQGQCYVPTSLSALPKGILVTSSGALPNTRFVVRTGKIGSGTCGTVKTNLTRCDVSAGNAAGTDSTSAPITFTLPTKK